MNHETLDSGLTAPGLALRNWSVQFGAVRALDDVSVTFSPARVTALLGENGSGKSTLVKVLAGIYTAEAGAGMSVRGEDVALPLTAPRSAALGIRFLHQDLGLLPDLSVAENIGLLDGFGAPALGWVSRRELERRARAVLTAVGIELDVRRPVGRLSMRDRTLVAFARMLADLGAERLDGTVIVLDEPTASLDPGDAAEIYRVVSRAAAQGAAVVLITHHLKEAIKVAAQVVVLRAGRKVADREVTGLSARDLARLMLGDDDWQEPAGSIPDTSSPTPSCIEAQPVAVVSGLSGDGLRDVGFQVGAGEIVGACGLRGAGPGALASILAGTARPEQGTLELAGRRIPLGDPATFVRAGMVTVPEDRRGSGVNLAFTIRDNVCLGRETTGGGVRGQLGGLLPIRARRETARARDWIDKLDIRPADPQAVVGALSGGNQQKVAIARALELAPRILVLDEPTQGVDVGARSTIGRMVREFAAAGGAVVLLSSNHEEILDLCDRVLVFRRGQIAEQIPRSELTRSRLLESVGGPAERTPA